MSLKFDKYVPPEHCQVKFDWESGTPLRVQTYKEGIYEGEVMVTKHSSKESNSFLELVNVKKLIFNKKPTEDHPFVRLEIRDIEKIQVLGPPNVLRFNKAVERIHRTYVIHSSDVFDNFVKKFLDTMPAKIGINFFGTDVGRDGVLYYIAMFIDDTLVVIDCLEMSKENDNFMVHLDKVLFSNESILKIAYNSRPIADYLYHHHSIYLKNVFDIQAVDFYLWASEQTVNQIEKGKEHLQYKPLSECLLEYLGRNVVPTEELIVLKTYEEKEKKFNQFNHPLRESPHSDPLARKWLAIEVKHLLPLHEAMNKRRLKNLEDCVTTNMTYHVSSNSAFFHIYDGFDSLDIPPAVIQKFLAAKVLLFKNTPVPLNQATSRLG